MEKEKFKKNKFDDLGPAAIDLDSIFCSKKILQNVEISMNQLNYFFMNNLK